MGLDTKESEFVGGITIASSLMGTLTSFGIGEFLLIGSFRGENLFLMEMVGGVFVE